MNGVSPLPPQNRLNFTEQRCFFFSRLPCSEENTFLSLMKRYTAFRDEITFQMASDSPSLFPVLSLSLSVSLTPSLPPSLPHPLLHLHSSLRMFYSIYCNCICHLALQTADKPAEGRPAPTLVMLINRLFVQAYQSPYPPSPVWVLTDME